VQKACKNPCSDCPFRKNSFRGWLGDWDTAADLSAFVLAGNQFPCHLTMRSAHDYEHMGTDEPLSKSTIEDLILYDSQGCRGAELYKGKRHALDNSLAVAEAYERILTREEFLDHHANRIG
jgi:hypothetical protein